MNETVLLIDDDRSMLKLIALTLERAGYRLKHAAQADAALEILKKETPDIILLDVEMPGLSGLQLLDVLRKDTRTSSTPIIMVTVKSDEPSKLQGLHGGADDYLVKPFSTKELLARVEAVLRRTRLSLRPAEGALQIGQIQVDFDRKEVLVKGKRVKLQPTEFDILVLLMRHKSYVLSYRTIGETLSKGSREMTSEHLYNHIKNLRIKLGPAGAQIETVYGTGYKLLE